jgi:SAM-dependent methyltransferase
MPAPSPRTYMFDNSTAEAALQVQYLADILDPHTENVLSDIDMGPDWRCLDLGAGAGTIAVFLATRCGVDHVVAIDKDPRYIPPTDRLEIREQDIAANPDLGANEYLLIHARLLFMHQPQREHLLERAVTALKPGGYLMVSDWDCTRLEDMLLTAGPELREAFLAVQNALIGLGTRIGMDPGWARRLPTALQAAGLEQVTGQIYNAFWTGGQPGMQLHACNSRQKEPELLDAGVTMRQLQIVRDGMQDPAVNGYSYPMVTAIGRRPL